MILNKLHYYHTGVGGNFLRVPLAELEALDLINKISSKSYVDAKHAYLAHPVDTATYFWRKYHTRNMESIAIKGFVAQCTQRYIINSITDVVHLPYTPELAQLALSLSLGFKTAFRAREE